MLGLLIKRAEQNKVDLDDINFKPEINNSGDVLVLHYEPKCERVIYDLSNSSGKIKRTGIVSNTNTTEISIENLTPGFYQVSVVDGDQIISQKIQL